MMKRQVHVDELKQYSLFIGTPMYGGQCSGSFTKACTDLSTMCAVNGIKVQFYFLFNESLIQRARNYVTDEFMRSECTHMMFIDSDIGFNAKDILAMLALQITDPEEYNIVCAPYPKKILAWEKIKLAAEQGYGDDDPFQLENYAGDYVFNPVGESASFRLDAPVEIGEGGTGFMLIPRATLEKFAEAYPEKSYLPDHARTESFDGSREIMAYFDCVIDPESKRYLSEDYFFCRWARKAGMKVWMCPWIPLHHIGMHVFKGSLGHLSQIGANATADKTSKSQNYKNRAEKRRDQKTKKKVDRNKKP